MAVKPNKRSKTQRYAASPNQLFQGATQTPDRIAIPQLSKDTEENLSQLGRMTLVNASRSIVSNFGAVKQAIDQQVEYAIAGAFNIQFIGKDKEYGALLESTINEWDKIGCIRGVNYDFKTSLKIDLRSIIRDGDAAFLLTENADGYPLYQSIASHRIGSLESSKIVTEMGPYQDFRISNGVIMNDYDTPIAYRVRNATRAESDAEIYSADDLQLVYSPDYSDQARGIPWLAAAINDCADIADIRGFLKTAIKAEASYSLIEHNEKGGVTGDAKRRLTGGPTTADAGADYQIRVLGGGTHKIFKAGTGSKIEAINSQRPATQTQDFLWEILRSCFASLNWLIEFYNPEALGGANIRLRVAQAVRQLEKIQDLAEKIATIKHRYAIAKLTKLGILPEHPEWWRFEHQRPRDLTVDNGRDIKADLEMYLKGIITMKELCARNGEYWEDVQDQKVLEEQRLQAQCKAAGVDPNRIVLLTPNGNPAGPAPTDNTQTP